MHKLKWLAGLLALLLVLLLAWGALIEPYQLDLEVQTAVVPGLPPAWEGQRIGVIADLQVGMWLDNEATVAQAVRRLVAERPAAVLLAGDFVYAPSGNVAEHIARVGELLRPLGEAGILTFAVLGNHDYDVPSTGGLKDIPRAEMVRAMLAEVGVRVLHNEVMSLPLGGGDRAEAAPLVLVGIGPHIPSEDNPSVALARVPDDVSRIVLMHNPATFATLPPQSAPFAVAGHTHGGQIRLPFLPEWSWLTFLKEEPVHTDGWIDDYGQPGNQLYVNRGIGFSKLPLRINCPPELTLFTLRGR
jgi:uncharacterized protein